MYVMYHSLHLVVCIFMILTTESSQNCLYQFTLTGQQQRKHAFHSSNFPFNYYSNETCIYQFFVSGYDSENVICFRFYRFDVGSDNVNCTDDYLTFSGNDLRYCGSGGLALSKRNLVPTAYHNIWSDQFCWPILSNVYNITFVSGSGLNNGHTGFYATFVLETQRGMSTSERCLPEIKSSDVQKDENLTQAGQDDDTRNYGGTIAPCKRTYGCSEDEWTCFNRQCIKKDKLCDLIDNCSDSSDEDYTHARCIVHDYGAKRSCNLEFNNCNFLGRTRWRRLRAGTGGVDGEPTADHTLANYGEGHYWLADLSAEDQETIAQFQTPIYRLDEHVCMSFYYYMRGRLTVELRKNGNWLSVWSRESRTDTWQLGQLELPTLNQTELRFTASQNQYGSWVALDDFYFGKGHCVWTEPSCTFALDQCGWAVPDQYSTESAWKRMGTPQGEYCMMYSINEARRAEKTTFTSPTISSSADGHCLSMTYTSDMDVGCGGSIKQSTWESDEYREVTILEQHSEKNLLKYNLTAVEPFSVTLELSVAAKMSINFAVFNITITEGICEDYFQHEKNEECTSCTPSCDENCSAKETPGDDKNEDIEPGRNDNNSSEDSGSDAESVVSFSAIGVGALVIISLVVTVVIFLVRMRKHSDAINRPRTESNNSAGFTDAETVAPMDMRDQPPSYSVAMSQPPQPAPTTLQMQLLSISAQVGGGLFDAGQQIVIEHRPPPPPYEEVQPVSMNNNIAMSSGDDLSALGHVVVFRGHTGGGDGGSISNGVLSQSVNNPQQILPQTSPTGNESSAECTVPEHQCQSQSNCEQTSEFVDDNSADNSDISDSNISNQGGVHNGAFSIVDEHISVQSESDAEEESLKQSCSTDSAPSLLTEASDNDDNSSDADIQSDVDVER